MSSAQYPSGQPQPQPTEFTPTPAPKKKGLLRKVAVPGAALLIGVGIGSASGGSEGTTTASGPAATTTATATVTAPAPPAVTVTAPPPAPVTVTEAPPAPPEPAGPATSFDGDGTFVVGEDIAPGTYRNTGVAGCYWARLNDLSGGFSGIIANGFSDGPQVVQIAESDVAFETNDCGEWAQR